MEPHEINSQILQTLRNELKQAGRGSITRVERELGLYSGYFRKSFRDGRLTISRLAEVLKSLDVKPADFFAKAFPTDPMASTDECSDVQEGT